MSEPVTTHKLDGDEVTVIDGEPGLGTRVLARCVCGWVYVSLPRRHAPNAYAEALGRYGRHLSEVMGEEVGLRGEPVDEATDEKALLMDAAATLANLADRYVLDEFMTDTERALVEEWRTDDTPAEEEIVRLRAERNEIHNKYSNLLAEWERARDEIDAARNNRDENRALRQAIHDQHNEISRLCELIEDYEAEVKDLRGEVRT